MMGKVIMSGIVPQLVAPSGGILASDLAVGSSVYLMEDGAAVEYLVVNQGIPSDSSLYDSSCDGTWLLRKDIYTMREFGAEEYDSDTCDIRTYLNETFLGLLDSDVQTIIHQANIPLSVSLSTYVSDKVFMLSEAEVGTDIEGKGSNYDGALLDYFIDGTTSDANAKRIAYYNGTAQYWWLRSLFGAYSSGRIAITSAGGVTDTEYDNAWTLVGVRPALILPSTALFDPETLLFMEVA